MSLTNEQSTSVTEEFVFNARQYFDFNENPEDLDGDSFFETSHEIDNENEQQLNTAANCSQEIIDILELSETESDSVFFSPVTDNATKMSKNSKGKSPIFPKMKIRRSLSMNNLPTDKPQHLQQATEHLQLEPNRPSSSCSHTSKRAPSQEHINRLAQPKRFTSVENINKMGQMTLAEAVNKFQAGTPKRFRTRPSPKINKFAAVPWGGTKAHSPKLLTTTRARSNVTNVISQEERERIEIEEAKKFKIRANPINKKAMRGPVKPPTGKKPPLTVTEPFKLTEVKKKQYEVAKIPPFKAQPVPKSLHNPFKLQETSQPTTKTQTPTFLKKMKTVPKVEDKVDSTAKPFKPGKTEPKPFSFEQRDKQLMKKKEEMINKVLEEEKKAREFHARPPPKAVLRSRNNSVDHISETGSQRKNNDDTDFGINFKARPATVLYTKPFEPKREDHDLKIEPFEFITEQRAVAWRTLEQQQKEKEMMKEAMKKELEELAKKKEEEEVARLRKLAEHKAQPIKKYKEIKIQKSNKVTQPISPVFHTDRLRNKENIEQ